MKSFEGSVKTKLSSSDRERIKRLFKRLDLDNNGKINKEEAVGAFGKKGEIFIQEFDRIKKKKS